MFDSMNEKLKTRAAELLESGAVSRILAWRRGLLEYDYEPAFLDNADKIDYNRFCGVNLTKTLARNKIDEGKTLVLARPCETYGLNLLVGERQLNRKDMYIIGVGCPGMQGKGREPLEKCLACTNKEHKIFDEVIGAEISEETGKVNRFEEVARLEGLTEAEREGFWRGHLSRCQRCHACRNICVSCNCKSCVFDNPNSGIAAKSNAGEDEENIYHIIRAYHVAGRCTDCGECSRACPEGIPLYLLNRKFIKDINNLYGEFQAGEAADQTSPLHSFELSDPEPGGIE